MQGSAAPDRYKVMCRQCGEIITHQLGRAEAVPCGNGHPVAPTIARAALVVRRQEGGSTSRTYTQPRQYTRREVNAHNTKYIAKMKRRRPGAKNETPAAEPEPMPDPFASSCKRKGRRPRERRPIWPRFRIRVKSGHKGREHRKALF